MERASRTTGIDRATLLRRAFRYYVTSNPDEVRTFDDRSIDADREEIRESGLVEEIAQATEAIGVDALLRLAAEEIDEFDQWLRCATDDDRYLSSAQRGSDFDRLIGL